MLHDDWTKIGQSFALEQATVAAMLTSMADTDHPFIYTGGSGVLADPGPTPVAERVTPGNVVRSRRALDSGVRQGEG